MKLPSASSLLYLQRPDLITFLSTTIFPSPSPLDSPSSYPSEQDLIPSPPSPGASGGGGGGDDSINWGTDVCATLNNLTSALRPITNESFALGAGPVGGSDIVCNGPHILDGRGHTVVVYAYMTPLLVMFTLITNLLVCIVLMRSTRSPTNTLLVAMAVSDTLTGVWPVPCYIYFYTAGTVLQ